MRDMTLEDVEDIEVEPNWSPIDMLAAVCVRASAIHKKEEEHQENQENAKTTTNNSPSRMVEFPKSTTTKEYTNLKDTFLIKNNNTAIVVGEKIIMRSSERTKFKKRIMSFDMTGYTSWKSNTTTDLVTWSWKDELDKKQDSDHHEEDDENVCHEESLRREKDLKRPMVDVERRIIRGSSSGLKRERSLSDDQEDEEKLCVPKKRNFIKFKWTKSESEQIPHAELPENVKNRINQLGKRVKEMKLIIQKEIYKTDASESHNRLSIPAAQITFKFLRDKEEEHLCMRSGKKVNPLEVRVIDPSLKISVLGLRRWEMKKVRKEVMKSLNSKQKQKEESKTSVSYVLNGKWTEMRIANGIEEGDRIQIWAVRMDDDDELIIVLVKLPDEVTTEEEVQIEEQEAEDCADSKFDKTNLASTSKQYED